MTRRTRLVLRALLAGPTRGMFGLDICRALDIPAGAAYPIFARLEHFGWLSSYWEDCDPVAEGRPQRRYYQLTDVGKQRAVLTYLPEFCRACEGSHFWIDSRWRRVLHRLGWWP